MSMLCLKSLPGNIFSCFLLVSFSFLLMKLTVLQLKYFIISEVVCVHAFLSLIFFFLKAAIVIALIVNKGVPPVQLTLWLGWTIRLLPLSEFIRWFMLEIHVWTHSLALLYVPRSQVTSLSLTTHHSSLYSCCWLQEKMPTKLSLQIQAYLRKCKHVSKSINISAVCN